MIAPVNGRIFIRREDRVQQLYTKPKRGEPVDNAIWVNAGQEFVVSTPDGLFVDLWLEIAPGQFKHGPRVPVSEIVCAATVADIETEEIFKQGLRALLKQPIDTQHNVRRLLREMR